METQTENLEAACVWMDESFGKTEGRNKRQADQFWRERLNSELLKAVKASDLARMDKWLNYGASVHAKCHKSGDGAVLMAASLENDAILQRLLALGGSPSVKNLKGQEPIHVAVWHGRVAAVKALCEKDPDIVNSIILKNDDNNGIINDLDACNIGEEPEDLISEDFKDETRVSPLHIASMKNLLYIMELLIYKGGIVEYSDEANLTPLDVVGIYAEDPNNAEECFINAYSLLITRQLRLPRVDKWLEDGRCEKVQRSNSALHTAVKFKYLTAIEDLLDKGACIGVWNRSGETAIHLSVRDKLMESLLAILKWNKKTQSLQVDARNKFGWTALQLGSFQGCADYVAVLIQGGADPSLTALIKRDFFVRGHWGMKFDKFVYSKDENTRKVSISDKETEPETAEPNQGLLTMTSCCIAVMGNSLECVKILCTGGDTLMFTSENEMNMLHLAAWCNAPKIMKFLIDKFKEQGQGVLDKVVNQICSEGTGVNEFGMAPIHFASLHSAKTAETIKLLVEEGKCKVKLAAQSKIYGNNTPLHFATMMGTWEDIELIYNYDNEALNCRSIKRKHDRQGVMVPHTAAIYNHREVLHEMLLLGADLSSISYDENRKFTLVETIEMFVDDYVDYLEEVLDAFIDLDYYDDLSYVVLKYHLLTPGSEEKSQMKVLKALVPNEKVEERQALLLHPLTETFLYLKWKKLKPVFNVYVGFQLVVTLLISSLGYLRHVNQKTAPTPEIVITIFRYLLGFMTAIMCVLNPNIEFRKLHKFTWLLDVQTMTWLAMIVASFVMVFSAETSRFEKAVTAGGILLSWIQLLSQLSRYPWSERFPLGYHCVMFLTVAAKFMQVVLSFLLLFIGFTLSFLVLMSDSEASFESPSKSFLKTLTMLNNFDDGYFFKNATGPDFFGEVGEVFGNAIFLSFFFLMCIAMVNFMTGIAIDDISVLKREGKARQIFEQSITLSRLEKIVLQAKTNVLVKTDADAPPSLTVWLKDSLHKNKDIPREMALSVSERVKKINQKKEDKRRKALMNEEEN